MIVEAIKKLIDRIDLSADEAAGVMQQIMSGNATDSQIGSFLAALRMKGETADEVYGLVSIMRQNADSIDTDGEVLDTCGTGGDSSGTFNISTAAAFVAAGAGAKVAKHGNRSVSSRCGSADVLEALGININLTAVQIKECLEKVGIAFLFAQALHPAMKYVAGPRREIGIRTVFNILGPLSNPAGAKYQLLGVFSKELTQLVAETLNKLGSKRAFVVFGSSGMDEIAIDSDTIVSELKDKRVITYKISPEQFGLKRGNSKELAGGDAALNAGMMKNLLEGKTNNALTDAVLFNSAFALVACGKAISPEEGLKLARKSIESGSAYAKLKELVKASQGLEVSVSQ